MQGESSHWGIVIPYKITLECKRIRSYNLA